jgi:DNA-3-methyladenine glycosylase I
MDNTCNWNTEDEMYMAYHDEEWGVPVHDDRRLFEFLILEGAQAGLSWLTILRKRAEYERAYDNFDIETVANYTESDVERLLSNAGIVRNKLKVRSSITNAKAVLEIQKELDLFQITYGLLLITRQLIIIYQVHQICQSHLLSPIR